MDLETAALLARQNSTSEIERQIAMFENLIADETDAEERAGMQGALATLREARRLQG